MLRLLHIFLIVFICFIVPILLFWWCTHRILIVSGSICGSLDSCGFVGSSYLVVSASIWVITCVYGKGPKWGVKYQFVSGVISMVVCERTLYSRQPPKGTGVSIYHMVVEYGSYFVASLAQWIVFWASISLWGWAYPIPCHLCENALPIDPKILSLGNGEKNFVRWVEHVAGNVKQECVILKDVMM